MGRQTLLGPIQWLQRHGSFFGVPFYMYFLFFVNTRNSQRIPQNCSILENFLFQLSNFYVPRSISSFIERHGTNTTAGDEVLKKLWSTEGGARLCLKSTISHVGKKVAYVTTAA